MSRVATQPHSQTQARTPAPATTSREVTHEKIAQRAYEKWMKRGCTHGCDRQDWTEAEAELKAECGSSVKQNAAAPMRR